MYKGQYDWEISEGEFKVFESSLLCHILAIFHNTLTNVRESNVTIYLFVEFGGK
jgi:hypothetical protein